jgi:hypothetical protein
MIATQQQIKTSATQREPKTPNSAVHYLKVLQERQTYDSHVLQLLQSTIEITMTRSKNNNYFLFAKYVCVGNETAHLLKLCSRVALLFMFNSVVHCVVVVIV